MARLFHGDDASASLNMNTNNTNGRYGKMLPPYINTEGLKRNDDNKTRIYP